MHLTTNNGAVLRIAALLGAIVPVARGDTLGIQLQLLVRDALEALPENATAEDKKWQPAMDFDTDGCYNTAAIDAAGTVNPGLEHKNTGLASECRDASRLSGGHNNVYARARCNNGWCAYLYDYYFEKDVAIADFPLDTGHRHDWEHIAVFVQNGTARVVAASQHGDYEVRPAAEVRWHGDGGTHPKMVYHKDGLATHCFRFATEDDEAIENHLGEWFYGDVVSYNGFPSTALRDKLFGCDFGKANIAIKDAEFASQLDKARGHLVSEFDSGVDDGSPGNPSGGTESTGVAVATGMPVIQTKLGCEVLGNLHAF